MFNPLKGLGDLNKMRQQALQIQNALAQERVVVEKNGVRVVMTGDQKIVELTIDGAEAGRVKNVIAEAIEKSQKVAAQKLAQMGGSF